MYKFLIIVILFFVQGISVYAAESLIPFRPEEGVLSPFQASMNVTRSVRVKRGQGLFHALKDLGVVNEEALGIINALRDEVDFSTLKVGDELTGQKDIYGHLKVFSFSQNIAEKHILARDELGISWNYHLKKLATTWSSRMIEGSVAAGSSFLSSLVAGGLSNKIANDVISALMCKINFRTSTRVGDRYRALISERKLRDKVIETKVIYTHYKGRRAGEFETFRYEDGEKGSTYNAHYTEDGQALIRAGLRYPLARMHVRSSFGMRRHPVTGRRAMHRGVDLRARSGTPVYSVASGKVILSHYNKFAGNKIGIRHSDGSSSYYFHLKKRLVKKGTHVRARQVIGRVGATGRVTGAHLHFGFKNTKGRWMNPLNKRMIATPKLSGERLASLKKQIQNTRENITYLKLFKKNRYFFAHLPKTKENNLEVEELFDLSKFRI